MHSVRPGEHKMTLGFDPKNQGSNVQIPEDCRHCGVSVVVRRTCAQHNHVVFWCNFIHGDSSCAMFGGSWTEEEDLKLKIFATSRGGCDGRVRVGVGSGPRPTVDVARSRRNVNGGPGRRWPRWRQPPAPLGHHGESWGPIPTLNLH